MALGTRGSLYEVLRVEPTATISETKMAYWSLAKVYHPDFSGNSRDFIEIHNSYETLSDPTARAIYDISLVSRRRTRTTSFGCLGRSGWRWEIRVEEDGDNFLAPIQGSRVCIVNPQCSIILFFWYHKDTWRCYTRTTTVKTILWTSSPQGRVSSRYTSVIKNL